MCRYASLVFKTNRPLGISLVLLCVGVILIVPSIRHAAPIPVTVDELIKSPDSYMDRYVEVRGRVGAIGVNECLGSNQALLSLTRPSWYVWIAVNTAFGNPFKPYDPKNFGPATVRGRLRWYYFSPCGFHGTRYFDVEEIEFETPPTP